MKNIRVSVPKIVGFIKAIDEKYFERFINNGEVCLNTVKWFREYEKEDSNIGDSFEGSKIACGKGMTLYFSNIVKSYNSKEDLKNKIDNARWSEPILHVTNLKMLDSDSNGNILSLYAIESSRNDGQVEEHVLDSKFITEFSNSRLVLIADPSAFISRIQKAMEEKGNLIRCDKIKYYRLDEELKYNLSLFDKQDKYVYQNEYRIISKDPNAERLILNLGSLRDICFEIFPREKMYKISNNVASIIVRMESPQLERVYPC